MQSRYGKKTYQALGQLLVKNNPEIAEQLLPFCQVTGETDLHLLPHLFNLYCQHYEIDPEGYKGILETEEKQYLRRLFVGAMLNIYNEKIFHLPGSNPLFRTGFVKHLSSCLHIGVSSMSQLIRKVIFYEKVYSDFSADIQKIVEQLKPHCHGHIKKN